MSDSKLEELTTKKRSKDFYNGFIELMKDEKIQLPLREDDSYKETLKNLYDYYCLRLSSFVSERQISAIRRICHMILQIIEEDNDIAYETFERLMKVDIFRNHLHIIKNELPVDGYGRTNINLFRLRHVIGNKNYKRIHIFHDPKTEENYKFRKPYRYNLEYRPSLYLASTVYCCCSELGLYDNKQMVIGSMFRINSKTKQELYIVDLGNRPIDYVKKSNKYKKANIGYTEHDYIFAYPLIAACSVVVPDKRERNIIEYKITEFLYRWLVKHHDDKLCAIRYFSCYDGCYSITDKDNNELFERDSQTSFTKFFINYAFPISKDIDDDGYCERLKEMFIVSNPKLLRDFATVKKYEEDLKYNTILIKIDKKTIL